MGVVVDVVGVVVVRKDRDRRERALDGGVWLRVVGGVGVVVDVVVVVVKDGDPPETPGVLGVWWVVVVVVVVVVAVADTHVTPPTKTDGDL